jgi:peroxiredoxin
MPRLSANGWLLVIFGVILAGLAGEPAYRAITGRKSAEELRIEKMEAAVAKAAGGPVVGQVPPAFKLKEIVNGKETRDVSLSDFKGRRVLLTFFCGCSVCRGVAQQWAKLDKAPLKGNPIVLGIWHPDADRVASFVKDTGAKNIIYLHDPDRKAGVAWGSIKCPRTWVVDESGKIAYRHEEMEVEMPKSPITKTVKALLEKPKLQPAAAS